MPESIEDILASLTPFLISELRALGCAAPSPERDDLLQEIRLRIWQVLRQNQGKEIIFFNAYVKKVVLSVFINEGQKTSREKKIFDAAKTDESRIDGYGRPRPGTTDMLKEVVREALESVGAAKRRVLELRLEGFSFEEIARLHSWSLRRAQSTYYRGIAELKDKLGKRGIDYED